MTPIDWQAEVARRFQDYPEGTSRYERQHREIRQSFRRLAVVIVTELPAMPRKIDVLDQLQTTMLLAQAVINEQDA